MKPLRFWIFALISFCFSPIIQAETIDHYENYNRSMFEFNMKFHEHIGKPIGSTYKEYVPQPVQTGVTNFVTNLKMPLNMVNNFLQGKVERGLGDFMRFTINSVFGLGGLIDIATPAGLPYEKEDFGQTLYVWGVWKEPSFIMLPILGPWTSSELFGSVVDSSYNPTYTVVLNELNSQDKLTIFGVDQFDSYIDLMDLIETLETMPDPYIFMRESFMQYRKNLNYDGKPPLEKLDDFDFE